MSTPRPTTCSPCPEEQWTFHAGIEHRTYSLVVGLPGRLRRVAERFFGYSGRWHEVRNGEHRFFAAESCAENFERFSSDVNVREHRRCVVLRTGRSNDDLEASTGHLFHADHLDCDHSDGTGDVVSIASIGRYQLLVVDELLHEPCIGRTTTESEIAAYE